MKKSHLAILIAVGFAVLIMIVFLIAGRVILGSGTEWAEGTGGQYSFNSSDGEYWEESSEIDGFSSIIVEGLWDVEIVQSDSYAIDVAYPTSWGGESAIRESSGALILGYPRNSRDPDESASATVMMPTLASVSIVGAGNISLRGFEEPYLDVIIEGAAMVKAGNSGFEALSIVLQGGGFVDFEDVPTVNAEVIMEGAGQVTLLMDGGVLEGRIDGLGRIVYSGTVSEERVDVDGIGRVKYQP